VPLFFVLPTFESRSQFYYNFIDSAYRRRRLMEARIAQQQASFDQLHQQNVFILSNLHLRPDLEGEEARTIRTKRITDALKATTFVSRAETLNIPCTIYSRLLLLLLELSTCTCITIRIFVLISSRFLFRRSEIAILKRRNQPKVEMTPTRSLAASRLTKNWAPS
jgi:hypothetical protein